MIEQKEIYEMFKKSEALLSGHFELTSGLHSEQYFQCALLLQYPEYCEMLAQALKAQLSHFEKPDLIIGPALGGVTLAYELARSFGVRGIFAERKEGIMQLRRGFKIKKGEKLFVVEDVVTTGGSVKEVINLTQKMGATVLAVASIVDRSSNPVDFGVPFSPLIKMEVKTYTAVQCPLCEKQVPIYKPGSKTIKN